MSSASMRQIARAFLTRPLIQGLPEVRSAWDNQMQLISLGGTVPQQTTSALHIMDERDVRISTPAVAGWTEVEYDFQLQICILLDGNAEDIIASADATIEGVKARLRSDPYMGQTSAQVFESAQGKKVNLRARRGDVQFLNTGLANGTPVQWVAVEWTACEWITA